MRLRAYLDRLQEALDPYLHNSKIKLCIHMEVVKQPGVALLRHNDLENFLTPIADRLRNSSIVLFSGEKRHSRCPNDRSRMILHRAQPTEMTTGFRFFSVPVMGSPLSWKAQIRKALIAADVETATEGALDMVVALRRIASSQSQWWCTWKPIGDALGPILGESRGTKRYDPDDDRIVRLAIDRSPVTGADEGTHVALWWREAADA